MTLRDHDRTMGPCGVANVLLLAASRQTLQYFYIWIFRPVRS
jgi:hypothetical protein